VPGQSDIRIDVVILGAGISGLTAAEYLSRAYPDQAILVVDEYGHVGGNHISVDLNGYSFDIGSFIFRSDTAFLDVFPVLRRRLIPYPVRIKRLNPAGKVTAYPFSIRDDVLRRGPLEAVAYLASLLWGRIARRPMRNAADFCRFWIGERFFVGSGLEHYIERFFGLPADKIDLEFANRRMTWVSGAASLGKARKWLRGRKAKKPVPILVRPQEGFSALYEAVRADLEDRGVDFLLGTELQAIARADERTVLSTAAGTVTPVA
jgi:protoporphyrinogen oxidase